MKVHLIDGSFELFRAYFGAPAASAPDGQEVGATKGLLRSMYKLLSEDDVSHVAFSFDHTVESFRNDMFEGYKTGEGLEEELWLQFPLAEEAASALGMVVWPMVEFEADDAISTAAVRFAKSKQVEQVLMLSPDKDLAQCISGDKIVSVDRIRDRMLNEAGVYEKFGVGPESIPDYLALVGDSADGIPGIPRWGAKSSSTVLAKFTHIENIPEDPESWDLKVRGAKTLASNLNEARADALLYKKLATLRYDVPLEESLDELKWRGVNKDALRTLCEKIGDMRFFERVVK